MNAQDSGDGGLSVHRSEALSDGIYAVAMTLLVIELKLPEQAVTGAEFNAALVHLLPKIAAWTISFFVLAMFWYGHHRAFAHVRRADGKLITLNLLQLAFVSLLPFSCALTGEHGRHWPSQVIYSANMALLSLVALLTARYIHHHPDPARMTMPAAVYRGVRVRVVGLIVISAAAVAIAMVAPGAGNIAFVLMWLIMPFSRRAERVAPAPQS